MNIETVSPAASFNAALNFKPPVGDWKSSDSTYSNQFDLAATHSSCVANSSCVGVTVISDHGAPFQPSLMSQRVANTLCHDQLLFSDETSHSRWVSIVKHNAVEASFWKGLNENQKTTRYIHVTREEDLLWIIWEALAAGNSKSLVAYLPEVNEDELKALNEAALLGNTHCILITGRKNNVATAKVA